LGRPPRCLHARERPRRHRDRGAGGRRRDPAAGVRTFERRQRAPPMSGQREATGEVTEKVEETSGFSRLRRAWRWMRATG